MITEEDKRRFDECTKSVLSGKSRLNGIGTLGEHTLHAILKLFLEPDTAFHEQKICGFVADILRGDEIIEIQTRAFSLLRKKLSAYRGKYRVTVVYPIDAQKYISWIDPDSGEISERHKSPKRGKSWQILRELYALCPIMPLHNVRFMLVFVNTEEYRVLSGRSRDKKHFGAARYERVPTELCDIINLEAAEDFAVLIPPTLGDTFTAAEFAKAAKMTPRAVGYAIRALTTLGIIEHTSNEGRAYVYTRKYK